MDILLIELISDGSPPIFVLGLLDKLLNLISGFLLLDFLEFIVIPEVLELIIPAVWDLANLDFDLLVLLIIRLVVTYLDVVLFLILFTIGTGPLEVVTVLCDLHLRSWSIFVGVNHFEFVLMMIDWLFRSSCRERIKCIFIKCM